ncbi:MAG TPA: PAS domain-containing protein, partial [Bacillota bacterium]|nr:PAS domain-containing protein [Bacillota bacterium]
MNDQQNQYHPRIDTPDFSKYQQTPVQPKQYSLLLDHVPYAVIGMDRAFTIFYWNKSAERLYGWIASEAIDQSAIKFLEDWFGNEPVETLRERLAVQGQIDFENTLQNQDGALAFLKGNLAVLKEDNGSIQGYIATIHDATEEKKPLDALAAENMRLKAIVDQIPAGIVVSNERGEIILTNPEANRLVGGQVTGDAYQPSGGYTIHRPDGSPFPPEDLPLPTILREKTPTNSIELIIRSDTTGELFLDSRGAPFFDNQNRFAGAVVILQDVTAQKKAEQALRSSEARLKLALRAADMVAWEWDPKENRVDVTGSYWDTFGIPNPQRGEDAIRLVYREDFHDHLQAIKGVLRGKKR